MAKQNKVGADDIGWKFHVYHIFWVIAVISLFAFIDWWLAILIVSIIAFYIVWRY